MPEEITEKVSEKPAKETAGKATRSKRPKKTGTEFAAAYLKKNPKAEFKEVVAAAKDQGIVVVPVTMKWARKAAGLTKRKATRGRRKTSTTRRVRGGSRKSAPSFRQEAEEKLREVASKAVLNGDDKTAGQLLEMIRKLK